MGNKSKFINERVWELTEQYMVYVVKLIIQKEKKKRKNNTILWYDDKRKNKYLKIFFRFFFLSFFLKINHICFCLKQSRFWINVACFVYCATQFLYYCSADVWKTAKLKKKRRRWKRKTENTTNEVRNLSTLFLSTFLLERLLFNCQLCSIKKKSFLLLFLSDRIFALFIERTQFVPTIFFSLFGFFFFVLVNDNLFVMNSVLLFIGIFTNIVVSSGLITDLKCRCSQNNQYPIPSE